MTVRRLQHVSIAVPRDQAESCIPFYTDVLGMEHIPNLAGLIWFRFGDGDHVHLLEGQPNVDSTHFAVQVDDLEQTLERARKAGLPTEESDNLWGAPRWFVRDPVGNRIELFETPPD
jgi:catechol 2,3-dioxygenase-like lactoylglutathione lyase family enzyme